MNILIDLFLTFFRIGLFTFGGGYAMLPLIEEEVTAHGWLTMDRMLNFVAVSESTPGPFAINMATYIGSSQGGILGAVCATLGVVMPSFIIILIVAVFYTKFKNNKYVTGCMTGLRPAVVGLIAYAAFSLAATVFFPAGFSFSVLINGTFIFSAVIFVLSTVAAIKKVHPILLIFIAAVLGVGAGYIGIFDL